MNRVFWRIWYAWSEYVRRSSDYSWFTSKIAVMFVSFLFLIGWLLTFAVIGKQRYLAIWAVAPWPRWYVNLFWFILDAGLLAWLFGSSSGRKVADPWRAALLVMALAGLLGLVTELLLRF